MRNLTTKFAFLLCFCFIAWGCEDETLTQTTDSVVTAKATDKTKTTKDSKFLKNLKVTGALEDGGTFKGKVSITEFGYSETEGLLVSGVIHGTATTVDGTETEINQSFSDIPATLNETSGNARMAAQQAECQILFLDIGPIFLDLLGLQVDLSEIILDITAVSGAGNLLGNLLCAVAGLLDPLGFLTDFLAFIGELTDLLERINDLIG